MEAIAALIYTAAIGASVLFVFIKEPVKKAFEPCRTNCEAKPYAVGAFKTGKVVK